MCRFFLEAVCLKHLLYNKTIVFRDWCAFSIKDLGNLFEQILNEKRRAVTTGGSPSNSTHSDTWL